ncbi:hypothetical protein PDPJ_3_00059 [Photobacterium damselae subsp. piscicida]|nr:hypothetical protein PDPJ_3_00059 [Photobacterium damselae subsp. piscicida]
MPLIPILGGRERSNCVCASIRAFLISFPSLIFIKDEFGGSRNVHISN